MITGKSIPILLLLAIILSAVSLVHAQTIDSISVVFDIQPDDSVKQMAVFYFSNSITDSSVNYTLSNMVRNIEVFDGTRKLNYKLTQDGQAYNLEIFLNGPTSQLTINYIADDLVFESDSIKHLFTEFSFEQAISNITVQTKLPEGFGIYQNSYRPSNAEIISDGRRIILNWQLIDLQEVLFSVKYASLTQESNIAVVGVILLIVFVIVLLHYFRRKTKEEFMKGFRTDEQKAIQYIEQRKVALQRDLQAEFKFSRAKATRIVSVLEQKGLVRKQPYGRTNKLFWIKGKNLGKTLAKNIETNQENEKKEG